MAKRLSLFSLLSGIFIFGLIFINSQYNVLKCYIVDDNLIHSAESNLLNKSLSEVEVDNSLPDMGVDDICAVEAARIAESHHVLSNEKIPVEPDLSLRCLQGYDGPLLPNQESAKVDTSHKVYDQISKQTKDIGGASSTKFDIVLGRAYAFKDNSQCIPSCNQFTFQEYKNKYESKDFLSKCPEIKSRKSEWRSDPEFAHFIGSDEAFFQTETNRIESPCCYDRTPLTLCDYTFRGEDGLKDSDRLLIGKYYYYAESVFETGIGESTKIATFTNVPRYTGIITDTKWVTEARDRAPERYRFIFGDIGATVIWGKPKNQSLWKNVLNYQIAPLQSELKPFDIYLVDGRYKVSNALICFLHAMKTGGDMERVRVVVHDYWDWREGHSDTEMIADMVDRSDQLVVFKLRSHVNEDTVFELWEKNMMNQE